MKFTWKRREGLYRNGDELYLGPWVVGSVVWHPSNSSGKKYLVWCRLPGICDKLPDSDSQDEAKKTLEKAVHHWLSKIDGEVS